MWRDRPILLFEDDRLTLYIQERERYVRYVRGQCYDKREGVQERRRRAKDWMRRERRWRALGRGGNKGQRYVFIDAKKSMQNIKVILQKLFMKKRI